jgi:hypothetical protein
VPFKLTYSLDNSAYIGVTKPYAPLYSWRILVQPLNQDIPL